MSIKFRIVSARVWGRAVGSGAWDDQDQEDEAFAVDSDWFFGKDDAVPWSVEVDYQFAPLDPQQRALVPGGEFGWGVPDDLLLTVCSPRYISEHGDNIADLKHTLVMESLDLVLAAEYVESRLNEYADEPFTTAFYDYLAGWSGSHDD